MKIMAMLLKFPSCGIAFCKAHEHHI